MEESDSPYEILQARKAVETGVARLAIKEATDEDLRLIRATWDERYELGLKGDYQTYIKMGRELHLSIARATKNRIIISIVDRLLDITGQPLWQNMRRLYYEKDASRIKQMLQIHNNIVSAIQARNSQEAMPTGGHIDIEILPGEDGGLRLTIRDSGVGIDPEDAEKLFDPFYTTKDTGTGLGLPFVQQVVQEHHGDIETHSEPGRGARFDIFIPEKLVMHQWHD